MNLRRPRPIEAGRGVKLALGPYHNDGDAPEDAELALEMEDGDAPEMRFSEEWLPQLLGNMSEIEEEMLQS